ncbi:MAG: glutaredoxin family protein [Planctomycetaceae bacterium]|nr:glutaredoxin family protein [Planctomycetaceae bacterium]
MTQRCSADTEPRSHTNTGRSYDALGMICLMLGIAGVAVVLFDAVTVLPFEIARFWLHSPSLALLGSVLLILSGSWLIWRSEHRTARWSPAIDGSRFESVVLYTRRDCGLCDAAAAVLAAYRSYLPPILEVDIDTDPDLVRQFDTCVPVVEIDGKVRFRGRVSELLLRRLIESTPPAGGTTSYQVTTGPRREW